MELILQKRLGNQFCGTFSLGVLILKIDSLNLFSTEPKLRGLVLGFAFEILPLQYKSFP